jgi:hypothetical protein
MSESGERRQAMDSEGRLKGTLFIPENEYGIKEGYYTINEIVEILRSNCRRPEVVHFIADMMEE